MAFRRRLPLDHDGLVGPAAGDDVLWGGAGRLLWEGDAGSTRERQQSGELSKSETLKCSEFWREEALTPPIFRAEPQN